MAGGENSLSRNPNVCASCSSMADGMGANEAEAGLLKDILEEAGKPQHVAESYEEGVVHALNA